MSEKVLTINEPLATIGDRIIAYIIDFFIMQLGALVCDLLVLIIWGIMAAIDAGPATINDDAYVIVLSAVAVIGVLIWMGFDIYYLVFWLAKHEGQSIGKKKRNIRIMIIEDESSGKIRKMTNKDIGIVLFRLIFTIVDAFFFFLVGLYLMNSDPNHQRFADKQAKTVVISEAK
ncbi:MAG: RDD family protein [Candidatus Thorarchaeota archaeon]